MDELAAAPSGRQRSSIVSPYRRLVLSPEHDHRGDFTDLVGRVALVALGASPESVVAVRSEVDGAYPFHVYDHALRLCSGMYAHPLNT